MNTNEIVKRANELTLEDLVWKELHPNNMKSNPLEGYYCLILHKDESGRVSGRKYTITFQYKEIEPGLTSMNSEIEAYILHEKSYINIVGPLEHPEPNNDIRWSNDGITFDDYEVNDTGSFIRAFWNIEDAKKRALIQYKAIYGYAMSHIV